MNENDKRPWEDGFRAYLEGCKLARNTINHNICVLKYDIVENILQKDFCGQSVNDLEPHTYLYMLQAKICLSGHAKWKDIWTAIEHLRHWKVGDATVISEPDAFALKQTVECILQGQQTMTRELTSVLRKMENVYNQSYELRTTISIEERATLLLKKEEKLRKWEEDLHQRELELQDKICKMTELHREVTLKKSGVKEVKGRDVIRKTQFAQSTQLIKERTIFVHKKHNIGTSNFLLHLMIVMRDLGFLTENVEATGFLRLLVDWEILSKDDNIRNIASNMSNTRKRLPEQGRMDFRSEEWQKAQYKADKTYCDDLAADFLADDDINRIYR